MHCCSSVSLLCIVVLLSHISVVVSFKLDLKLVRDILTHTGIRAPFKEVGDNQIYAIRMFLLTVD